jgi:hypothetical protein
MKKTLLLLITLVFTNIALAQNKHKSLITSFAKNTISAQKDSLKTNLKKTKTLVNTSNEQVKKVLNTSTSQVEKLQQAIPSIAGTTIPNEKVITDKLVQQIPSVNSLEEKAKQVIPNPTVSKKVYYIANNVANGNLVNSLVPKEIEASVDKLKNSLLKKVWDKTVYSFDIALGANQGSNLLKITPAVGIRMTKYYTLGIGFPIQYTSFNQNINQKSFEDFMYGIKVYHRLHLPKGIYLQADGDFLNSSLVENQVRQWIPAMWTGFGYNKKLTKNFGASIMVMYNPLYRENYTPYSLPLDIRVGFNWYQITKPIFK